MPAPHTTAPDHHYGALVCEWSVRRATTHRPGEVDVHQHMDSAGCVRYPGTKTHVEHTDNMTGGLP
jgi:hypothetical protein